MSNLVPIHMIARRPGWEHVPIYPKGFVAIRIVQLVLALIMLGLTAYGLSEPYVRYDGTALILSMAVMTVVTSIYHLVVEFGVPAGYNYWAILGLDIFFVVLWLIAFAILAAQVALALDYDGYSYYFTSEFLSTQATAASLGGAQFILYLISLIIHSISLHRHRSAGLHCMPRSAKGPLPPGTVVVPVTAAHGHPVPMYPQQQQQMPPQYLQQGGGGGPQQGGQQFYGPPPPHQQQQQQGGYYMMPMPGQQMPGPPPQQMMMMPGQQQQPPQNGFYPPPQPSQSPAPQIVPQPTGGSQATSLGQHSLGQSQQQQQHDQGQQQQHDQGQQQQHGQGQGQQVPQLPNN